MEFDAILNSFGNGGWVKISVIEQVKTSVIEKPPCRLITGYVSRVCADAKRVDLCPYVIFNFQTSEADLSPVSPPDVDGALDCEAAYEGLVLENGNPHSIHVTTNIFQHTYRALAVARGRNLANLDAFSQYIRCADKL